mmetsp:Transcript_17177/g.22326  ORF Transcript_17177/g.22326 Transcript_17177/m.22326 type:complete len:192 (+) Transcript_17177:17-592(+)
MWSEDAMEEIQESIKELGLTLRGARPWGSEFFAVFKPPKAKILEERMATNLLHYKANYCQIVFGALILSVITSPKTIFALLLSATLFGLVMYLRLPKLIEIGDFRFRLKMKHRILLAFTVILIILIFTRVFFWLLFIFCASLFFVILHMIFRPRSLSARYDAAIQDVRRLFSFDATDPRGRAYASRVDPFE